MLLQATIKSKRYMHDYIHVSYVFDNEAFLSAFVTKKLLVP